MERLHADRDKNTDKKIFLPRPDLDAESSLTIFNNFNKKTPEEIYNEGAVTSFIKKDSSGQDLIEKKRRD